MDFQFPTQADRQLAISNGNFVPENIIPIDVAVNYRSPLQNSRIFVTMPRFMAGVPITLGFVKHSTNVIEPYPNYKWHSSGGNDCDYMTSVFRVAFDTCNQMWVLDSGKIGSNQVCQPKLLVFNLATDSLVKRFRIPSSFVTSTTLFITPIVDVKDPNTCRDVKVYIGDCCSFTIVVYDYATDRAWQVNNKLFYPYPTYGTFRIAGESFELMDGLLGMAITNKKLRRTDSDRSLLFHALASGVENAVELSVLNNETVWSQNQGYFMFSERFNIIGNRNIQTGAQAMDKNGNLFFVLLNPLALVCWDSETVYKTENIKVVYQNDQTMQFASGIKIVTNMAGEEEIWIVTNRLQKFMNGNVNKSEINYRIHVGVIRLLLNNHIKCNGQPVRQQQQITFPYSRK
ncbi:hypothetical protein PVAND_001319 [Polypedilum vanderplanki]|uniref:Uncharacterized protein n=1 Tax=Polypedilum vanderplanki TaxID=319348 RepID=A0A9J6BMK3_POLVA|nr:hypothetical protein PVAND_001319 [Polypedilum vanderplanki]